MKNKIVLFLLVLVAACSTTPNTTGKILTKNIPSTDKLVKEGRLLQTKAYAESSNVRTRETKEYNVIERLYDTVWFQTEEEFDDGKLEVETEFVIFDNKSWVLEREMENGVMEEVEDDDFSKLTYIDDIDVTGGKNAVIVLNTSMDEKEYEGYWLKDDHNLFIVEGASENEVKARLNLIMKNPSLSEYLDTEKFLLSTNLVK